MTPSPQAGAPLPPLPNLSAAGGVGGGQTGTPADAMSALVSGVAPVKKGVDMMLQGAKMVVQSGAVPGAEQVCGQIVALATSLLPMAAQQALQPGMSAPGVGTPPPGPPGAGPVPGGPQ